MQFYFIFILLANIANLSMEFHMTEQEMKAAKGKFCGRYLSDTLTMLCNAEYNTRQKKNVGLSSNDVISQQEPESREDLESLGYPEDALVSFPFRNEQHAKSIIPTEFRKRGHGVASECCHKACSLWEMYGYCGGH